MSAKYVFIRERASLLLSPRIKRTRIYPFKWISSAEGPEFASEMNDFVKTIKELGPSPLNTNVKERQKEQQAA